MPELWRILPANGASPILFMNRQDLDYSVLRSSDIANDRKADSGLRAAASAVVSGQVQVAARVEWADSE